jgi:hypothetical protein
MTMLRIKSAATIPAKNNQIIRRPEQGIVDKRSSGFGCNLLQFLEYSSTSYERPNVAQARNAQFQNFHFYKNAHCAVRSVAREDLLISDH